MFSACKLVSVPGFSEQLQLLQIQICLSVTLPMNTNISCCKQKVTRWAVSETVFLLCHRMVLPLVKMAKSSSRFHGCKTVYKTSTTQHLSPYDTHIRRRESWGAGSNRQYWQWIPSVETVGRVKTRLWQWCMLFQLYPSWHCPLSPYAEVSHPFTNSICMSRTCLICYKGK